MSLAKAKRKIKRIGKTAVQFRISSTFEFIELECKGTWRPDKLRVVWLRNHRKVKSNDTTMVVTEDFGPNGAKGKAIFNPAIAVSLLVTLYRDSSQTEFEEKEYKYMIESEGESGKKILATFSCNVAEFVGIPSTKQALDLNFKCVSKKVKAVKLGITLESTFMKEGKALDDDMQSTYSAVSTGVESVTYDDEDDDEAEDTGGASGGASGDTMQLTQHGTSASNGINGNRDRLNTLLEESVSDLSVDQSLVLGTGEHISRAAVSQNAPPKPARGPSFKSPSPDQNRGHISPTTENGLLAVPTSSGSALPAANGTSLNITVESGDVKGGSKPYNQQRSGVYDKLEALPQKAPALEEGGGAAPTATSDQKTPGAMPAANGTSLSIPVESKDVKGDSKPYEQQRGGVYDKLEALVQNVPAPKEGGGASSAATSDQNKGKKDKQKTAASNGIPGGTASEGSSPPVAAANVPAESLAPNAKKVEIKSDTADLNRNLEQAANVNVHSNHDQEPKGQVQEVKKIEAVKSESQVVEEGKTNADRVQEVSVKAGVEARVVEKSKPVVVSLETQAKIVEQERKKKMVSQETQTLSETPTKPKTANRAMQTQLLPDPPFKKTQMVDRGVQTVKEEAVKVMTKDEGMQTVKEEIVKVMTTDEGMQTELEVVAPTSSANKEDPNPKKQTNVPELKETVLDSPSSSPPVSHTKADHVRTSTSTSSSTSLPRKSVDSKEASNPYLEEGDEETLVEEQPKKRSPTSMWIDSSVVFVDCFEEVMGRERLDKADIIGLYFSAGWCPPCRRFLPKLVKFYHHLKQHGKSFELIYISSDYSKQDMTKYMKEQQMPWVGVEYEGEASDNFRKTYKVSAVPLLKILGTRGYVIEESAKKLVEGASNGSAILKLYNKWHEQLEDTRVTKGSRKGILSKIKKSKEDSEETSADGAALSSERSKESKGGKVTQEMLDGREEKIQHLEEVNKVLKQANEEMREEIEDLKAKLSSVTTEMEELRTESSRLQDESKQMVNNLNLRGWLFKRGIKGPTANRWRRRYFRLDEGSKLNYYKNSTEGTPQGFIDLDKVLSVQEVSPSQQDKNHATFNVQCDGRIFQMQAHDEASMKRWIEAILYITEWRKRNSTVSQIRSGAHP